MSRKVTNICAILYNSLKKKTCLHSILTKICSRENRDVPNDLHNNTAEKPQLEYKLHHLPKGYSPQELKKHQAANGDPTSTCVTQPLAGPDSAEASTGFSRSITWGALFMVERQVDTGKEVQKRHQTSRRKYSSHFPLKRRQRASGRDFKEKYLPSSRGV